MPCLTFRMRYFRQFPESRPLVINHTHTSITVRLKSGIVHNPCGARKDGEYECDKWCLRPHNIHIVLHVHDIIVCNEEGRLVNRWQ